MIGDIIETAIQETFELLNFNTTSKGYRYLVETIILINDKSCDSLGESYYRLSVKYRVDQKAMRSIIQRYIKSNIKKSSHEALMEVFKYDINQDTSRSRNYYLTSEFVYYILSYMNSKYKSGML